MTKKATRGRPEFVPEPATWGSVRIKNLGKKEAVAPRSNAAHRKGMAVMGPRPVEMAQGRHLMMKGVVRPAFYILYQISCFPPDAPAMGTAGATSATWGVDDPTVR